MAKTNSGQSLVTVLMSVAITGVILAVITTVMTNSQRETQALTEKLTFRYNAMQWTHADLHLFFWRELPVL